MYLNLVQSKGPRGCPFFRTCIDNGMHLIIKNMRKLFHQVLRNQGCSSVLDSSARFSMLRNGCTYRRPRIGVRHNFVWWGILYRPVLFLQNFLQTKTDRVSSMSNSALFKTSWKLAKHKETTSGTLPVLLPLIHIFWLLRKGGAAWDQVQNNCRCWIC